MYIIQGYDYEEGSCALWFVVKPIERFETLQEARAQIHLMRKADGDEGMIIYRAVVEDSRESFSQPTDRLEY